MAKNKKEITHLNYGELHMYYPIKFDTNYRFQNYVMHYPRAM